MPTQLLLEDFVPYDKSLQWRLHDAYFANRGIAAWTAGDVPYFSTSNYAIARQHALFLIALVKQQDRGARGAARGPVFVLEIGSGLGRFAVHLFRALDRGTGRAGKLLGARLRYILSDYSETSVREAVAAPGLRELERAGRLTPALFDVRRPQAIKGLDGRPLEAPLAALYSNYVCCVTHMKHLRKTKEGWREKHVRIQVEIPDQIPAAAPPSAEQYLEELLLRPTKQDLQRDLKVDHEWRPTTPEGLFEDAVHARALERAAAGLDEATVGYPYAFLDMLRGLRGALRPDGVMLVNDYGTSEAWELRGLAEKRPQHYGNTMNQSVDYPVLEAFAEEAGLGCVRTRDSLRSVHIAAFRTSPEVPPALRRAFRSAFVDRADGEDMLDLGAAARQWMKVEEPTRAAKLLQRCLKLDPLSAEAHFRFGDACLDAGYNEPALRSLEKGRRLEGAGEFDFDFAIGRACYRLKRFKDAERAYRSSLEREDDAVTHANLGVIYEERGDFKRAYACYRRSRELKPDYERAKTLVAALEKTWAEKSLGTAPLAPARSARVTTSVEKDGVLEETVSFGEAPVIPTPGRRAIAGAPPKVGAGAGGKGKAGAKKGRGKAGTKGR